MGEPLPPVDESHRVLLSALEALRVYQNKDRWPWVTYSSDPGRVGQDLVSRGCGSRAWWVSPRPAASSPRRRLRVRQGVGVVVPGRYRGQAPGAEPTLSN